MSYLGDIRLGDTIDFKFTTVDTSGVPITLAGTPVISAYVGNSTTEITAGITLTVDFDARTGMHNVRVVATSGNGFATATNVELVITTGTVSGASVIGYVVGTFSIENRSALIPATVGRTIAVTATGTVPLDSTERNATADAILNRDFTSVSDTNARTLLNAARFLRNKWSITTGTLTVTKENDTTSAWTSVLVGTPGADPVTSSDPA